MLETSARLLRLLGLLQAQPLWTGPELAERLGVGQRTIRNDIGRLRALGYPVEATRGSLGGYRLGPGVRLPPLLLDDDEAVALTVGLRAATGLAGTEEVALRALAKVDQVLPAQVRGRVAALDAHSERVPDDRPGPEVDHAVLTALATACRDRLCVRFDYRTHDGASDRRDVEPHRLVAWGRRWYLVAHDRDRDAWRTFRVDRIGPPAPAGPRFAARPLPDDDVTAWVSARASAAAWRYRCRVVVHDTAEAVAARLPPAAGRVEPRDATTCTFHTGADALDTIAVHLGRLGVDFAVAEGPPELAAHLAALAQRYARAARRSAPGGEPG